MHQESLGRLLKVKAHDCFKFVDFKLSIFF